MANEQHLSMIKDDVERWNVWREIDPDLVPDLTDADLSGHSLIAANLSRCDLQGANLSNTDLVDAELSFSDLAEAKFTSARLARAALVGVQLSRADLRGARLVGVDLTNAWLMDADLSGADLARAVLKGADVSGATFGHTSFQDTDLSETVGLVTAHHSHPSSFDWLTLVRCTGKIPTSFLRSAGVPQSMLSLLPSYARLGMDPVPTGYYSCFISYSVSNNVFVKRLFEDLTVAGVMCFLGDEHLKTGGDILEQLTGAILSCQKFLLVLSAASAQSPWVEQEVGIVSALHADDTGPEFFPVHLDDTFQDSSKDWIREVYRSIQSCDFRSWHDEVNYQESLARLLHHLKI